MKKLPRVGIIAATLAAACGAYALRRQAKAAEAPLPTNHLGGKRSYIDHGGYKIFATEIGEGPSLVFVHGVHAGASSYEFRDIARLLAVDHRVILFDFLGCGLSDRPPLTYTADLFVDQIIDVLGTLQNGPVTLIGSSYGAAYALAAAARAEDRVGSVVALSPAGLERRPPHSVLGRKLVELLLRSRIISKAMLTPLGSPWAIRTFLQRVYFDKSIITPRLVAHYQAMSAANGARFVTAAFLAGELTCDIADELPFLGAPILIIDGTHGSLGVKDGAFITSLAKDATRHEIAATGLLPHEEQASRVAQLIREFTSAQHVRTDRLTEAPLT